MRPCRGEPAGLAAEVGVGGGGEAVGGEEADGVGGQGLVDFEGEESVGSQTLVGDAGYGEVEEQRVIVGDEEGHGRLVVKDGDTLSLGKHELKFLFAPMVHWPKVMFTYDAADKVLFSPHIAGVTVNMFRKAYRTIWDNIFRAENGEEPVNQVNK